VGDGLPLFLGNANSRKLLFALINIGQHERIYYTLYITVKLNLEKERERERERERTSFIFTFNFKPLSILFLLQLSVSKYVFGIKHVTKRRNHRTIVEKQA